MFYNSNYLMSSDNKNIVERAFLLSKNIPEIYSKIELIKNLSADNTSSVYSIIIKDNYSKFDILISLGHKQKQLSSNIEIKNALNLHQPSFLRGVFLSCGAVSDPKSGYHLEFNVPNKPLSLNFIELLSNIKNAHFTPHYIERRKDHIVYIKISQQITDFLALIGASKSAMDFIQIKMVKEVRNYINRTTNFETANLSKTAEASIKQIKAIENIISIKGLDWLPQPLRETALIRLQNPYIPLEQLSSLLSKPVSKSGINHRLKKIIKLSENLDK